MNSNDHYPALHAGAAFTTAVRAVSLGAAAALVTAGLGLVSIESAPAPDLFAAIASADTPAPAPDPLPVLSLPIPAPAPAPSAPAPRVYTDDLDGWILQSLDIMAAHSIPGSYDGIYRNIMRESGGNPQAINLYDENAAKGIPSKGLLQVIDPTFAAYHVEGTADDIWDPVANIVAACNYAAARYGSMDNVSSAY